MSWEPLVESGNKKSWRRSFRGSHSKVLVGWEIDLGCTSLWNDPVSKEKALNWGLLLFGAPRLTLHNPHWVTKPGPRCLGVRSIVSSNQLGLTCPPRLHSVNSAEFWTWFLFRCGYLQQINRSELRWFIQIGINSKKRPCSLFFIKCPLEQTWTVDQRIMSSLLLTNWATRGRKMRKLWDSNSRPAFASSGFQDQCIQPLCQTSK